MKLIYMPITNIDDLTQLENSTLAWHHKFSVSEYNVTGNFLNRAVYIADGSLVGIVLFGEKFGDSLNCFICVKNEFRNQHIGSTIMEDVIAGTNHLSKIGFDSISFHISNPIDRESLIPKSYSYEVYAIAEHLLKKYGFKLDDGYRKLEMIYPDRGQKGITTIDITIVSRKFGTPLILDSVCKKEISLNDKSDQYSIEFEN